MDYYYADIDKARARGRKAAKLRHANQSEHLRLKRIMSARIYNVLRRQSAGRKAKRTMELVGCTIPELREHLQNQFTSGMSWDNYGAWHIDHKRPCASFDLSIAAQQMECFHFTNLQPLWADDNIRKSDKWQR